MKIQSRLTRAALAAAALSLLALASCAKDVGDRELAQAYSFYLNAPTTLTKVLATSNTENFVAESLSNPDGSYTRKTEINQADKTSKITATFRDYHPASAKTVSIDGEVVMTSLGAVFSLNGSLTYKGMLPKTLTFKNASLRQGKSDDGQVSFSPVKGTVVADRRVLTVDEFFTEILK